MSVISLLRKSFFFYRYLQAFWRNCKTNNKNSTFYYKNCREWMVSYTFIFKPLLSHDLDVNHHIVTVEHVLRYSRACSSYQDFLDRGLLITGNLPNQGFILVKLKSSLQSFTVSAITWLTVMEYLCHKYDHGFSLNIFYLLKYAKRIRHKLNKLM